MFTRWYYITLPYIGDPYVIGTSTPDFNMAQANSNVSAVSLTLPVVRKTSPNVWFVQTEAQFGTRNITTDQTTYNYIVVALDEIAADRMEKGRRKIGRPCLEWQDSIKRDIRRREEGREEDHAWGGRIASRGTSGEGKKEERKTTLGVAG